MLAFFCFLSLASFAQEKKFNEAIARGRTPGDLYYLTPKECYRYTESAIRKYADDNGITIYKLRTAPVRRFGVYAEKPVYVEFLPDSEIGRYRHEPHIARKPEVLFRDPYAAKISTLIDKSAGDGQTVHDFNPDYNWMTNDLIREVMDAKHLAYSLVSRSLTLNGYIFIDIKDLEQHMLDRFANGVKASDFKNKVKIPYAEKEEYRAWYSVMWSGDIDTYHRPVGSGYALSVNSDGTALLYNGNFIDGYPDGKLVSQKINLEEFLLSIKNDSKFRAKTDTAHYFYSEGLLLRKQNWNQYYCYDKSLKYLFGIPGHLEEKYQNGLALSSFQSGSTKIYAIIDTRGKICGYDEAALPVSRMMDEYIKIMGTAEMSTISSSNLNLNAIDAIDNLCKAKFYVPDSGFLSYFENVDLKNESVKPDVLDRVEKLKSCLALYKAYDLLSKSNPYLLQSDEISRQQKLRVSTHTRFTNSGAEIADNVTPAFENAFEMISQNFSELPSNWEEYKNGMIALTMENKALYHSITDKKAREIFDEKYERAVKREREIRQSNVDYANSQILRCRIDGDKSTFPQGWVPEDDSLIFGHPGFSEKDGKIVLEDGTEVEWCFYGDQVMITSGIDRDKKFDTISEMVNYIIAKAVHEYERMIRANR